jgi:hypothetical protein
MTNVQHAHFGRQVVAIVLLAGGWGWDSGQFVQPFFGSFFGGFIDLVHFAPVLLLLAVSPAFLRAAAVGTTAKGARNTITGITIFSLLAVGILTAIGLANPNPNSVGVHTFEDFMPVIVLVVGSILWLTALIPARRGVAQAQPLGNA